MVFRRLTDNIKAPHFYTSIWHVPKWLFLLFLLYSFNTVNAQELEPRALTNIPTGMNFVLVGYGYTQGDILLDPAVPIEDLKGKVHSIIGAYARSINVFGLSGKLDVVAPYAIGDWEGKLSGVQESTSRSGMGDIRLRFSFNFLGAPALKMSEFASFKQTNISGFSVQVIAPTGQYDPDKLINLGSNRWVFRPQWGFSKKIQKWYLETYLSAWIFTKNSDFYGETELRQNNLYALKFHAIRGLKKGMWMAFNAGYAIGGRTFIDDEERDTRISTFRLGFIYALPLGKQHSLKFTGFTTLALEKGGDYDALLVAYQFRFGGKK